jgi:hypothetical protein
MSLSIADRVAVADLMTRYAFAIDLPADQQTFLDLFTEDAALDGRNGPAHGVEAIKKLAQTVRPSSPRQSRHLIANLLIDGDGDHADIHAYFLRVKTKTGERPGDDVEQSVGTYDCAARKADGVWKLERRVVAIDGD